MYKKHERMLTWVAFIAALIMGLSLLGRVISG
jgi:hypothetical protein